MLSRLFRYALIVGMFAVAVQTLEAQPYRRRDLSAEPAADQAQLRQLIMNYLTAPVIALHLTPGIHSPNEHFLIWHRGYIAGLEAWLMTQPNGTKYVPLPKYDPNTAIPNDFFNSMGGPPSVVPGYPLLVVQNPGIDLSAYVPNPDPCPWTPDAFGSIITVPHNTVHTTIDGSMGATNTASAAGIFWPWHAFLDDMYFYHQCNCWGARAQDLYMKDDVQDIGDEPNTTAPHGVYNGSPDIWVRNTQDVLVGTRYTYEDDPTHYQNPIAGTTNYIYVRVRNRGCQPTPDGLCSLRVYRNCFSLPGTWPTSWTEITSVPVMIPSIPVGGQYVAEIAWTPRDPKEDPTACDRYCLLARLESAVDGDYAAAVADVISNVKSNNNWALRNVNVVPVDPIKCTQNDPCNPVYISQVYGNTQYDKIGFEYTYDDRHGYNPVYIEVDLGKDLYTEWQKGGYNSYGIEDPDRNDYKVTVTQPGAYLGNIHLTPGRTYDPCVHAYIKNPDRGGYGGYGGYDGYGGDAGYGGYGGYSHAGGGSYGGYGDYGGVYPVHVLQYESTSRDAGEQCVGGATYEVRAVRDYRGAPDGRHITGETITYPACPQSYGSIQLSMNLPSAQVDRYSYYWSNGASTRDVYDLAPGTYSVTVRDNTTSPCTVDSRTYEVYSTSRLDVYMDSHLSHCYGSDGSASCAPTGGDGNYSYQWYYADGSQIPGATYPSLNNVAAGAYTVEVRDDAGCSKRGTAYVYDEWNILTVDVATTNASGQQAHDGTAHAIAEGMAPYTYAWSTGEASEQIAGLAPGEYWVDVSDMGGAGCKKRTYYTISYPGGLPQSVEAGESIVTGSMLVPNPASGATELRYRLRRSGIVQIELYNSVGRRIDLLFNGNLPLGDQTLSIGTMGLASGQYSVRIVTGKATTSVPLTVVH